MKNSLRDLILGSWETNNRVTEFLFENLPAELWSQQIPGSHQKTIRMLAGHIHNARCMWIKMIGKSLRVKSPISVDRRNVTLATLLRSLKKSNQAMVELLTVGLNRDGQFNVKVPWMNFPANVVHFMSYMIAHEAHHRGQIVLVARMLGHPLPPKITNGLWQWNQRLKEIKLRK